MLGARGLWGPGKSGGTTERRPRVPSPGPRKEKVLLHENLPISPFPDSRWTHQGRFHISGVRDNQTAARLAWPPGGTARAALCWLWPHKDHPEEAGVPFPRRPVSPGHRASRYTRPGTAGQPRPPPQRLFCASGTFRLVFLPLHKFLWGPNSAGKTPSSARGGVEPSAAATCPFLFLGGSFAAAPKPRRSRERPAAASQGPEPGAEPPRSAAWG